MKLQEESFERMEEGVKTIELRLFDEKRQLLNLGDEVEFVRMANADDKVRVEIIGLLRYKTFADLIGDLSATYFGYEDTEKDYLKSSMYEIYTPEEEAQYGVLGIRIKLIGTEKR